MKYYLLIFLLLLPLSSLAKKPGLVLKDPKFLIVSDQKIGGIWVVDEANSKIKYCDYDSGKKEVACSRFRSVYE